DEVLLRREVAVERSHPDARMTGDLLDRDLDAGAGEELPRARDEPLVVAAGVAAQGRRGHDPSMPESGAFTPFRREMEESAACWSESSARRSWDGTSSSSSSRTRCLRPTEARAAS